MFTRSLRPNLDPLTIIANIINKDIIDDDVIIISIIMNRVIIIISNLRSIKMIFFRHQHILIVPIIIMNIIILILRFSTSKVDIFY